MTLSYELFQLVRLYFPSAERRLNFLLSSCWWLRTGWADFHQKDPPSPVLSVQEKIEKMWRRKVEERIDYNYMIQHKKGFRNPSIYEKLIEHLDIDELGKCSFVKVRLTTNIPFLLRIKLVILV
jgi:hypothetical protein